MNKFDADILTSIWKWKFLTTSAITQLHFSKFAPAYAHRRLLGLKMAGFIEWLQIHKEPSSGAHAWTLTPKGFTAIQSNLPCLMQDGFRSESIEHDYICTAFHLGNWIYGLPAGCEIFSEQELRRFHLDQYPEWIPKVDGHRPDGYWRTTIGNEQQTIAIEFEKRIKSVPDYSEIAAFYSVRTELFRVVWLVSEGYVAKRIQNAMLEAKGKGARLHNYILQGDFSKSGWDAKIFLGRDIGVPLSRMLPSMWKTGLPVGSVLLLDTRKSPHKAGAYAKLKNSQKTHRLGSTLVSSSPSSLPHKPTHKGEPTNET